MMGSGSAIAGLDATKAVYSALIAKSIEGNCGKLLQFVNPPHFRDGRRKPGNRVRRYRFRWLRQTAIIVAHLFRCIDARTAHRVNGPWAGFAPEHWSNLDARGLAANGSTPALPEANASTGPSDSKLSVPFFIAAAAPTLLAGVRDQGNSSDRVCFVLRIEDESGIVLDALLIGEADLAILFSFTRAYFASSAVSIRIRALAA